MTHDPSRTPRCTSRGCPVRFRAGADRPCPLHADDDTLAARMDAMGAVMAAAPGERDGVDSGSADQA